MDDNRNKYSTLCFQCSSGLDILSNRYQILVALSLIGLYFIVSTLTPIPTNTPPQQGVLVIGVGDHTLAQSVGLSKGSVIETVAGLKVHNLEELGKFLRSNLG